MSYIYMEHLLLMFLDHTQRRSTVGRTSLDEWSARRRDLYLTTNDTQKRQISMPRVGVEPTISAGERHYEVCSSWLAVAACLQLPCGFVIDPTVLHISFLTRDFLMVSTPPGEDSPAWRQNQGDITANRRWKSLLEVARLTTSYMAWNTA
jgi:hypothetical protein